MDIKKDKNKLLDRKKLELNKDLPRTKTLADELESCNPCTDEGWEEYGLSMDDFL